MEIVREITPLTQNDCFTIFSRTKTSFDFPLHNHEDMELNLILDGTGAQRIVGDHIGEIGPKELVFTGPNLNHGWFTHECRNMQIKEVTIQFHREFFSESFMKRNQLVNIRNMFENSKRGILFSDETITHIAPRIMALAKKSGFDSILELMSIMHDLSTARDSKLLSDSSFTTEQLHYNSRRIERVFDFMNKNFHRHISLTEVAKVAGMPEASFSRFMRQSTGFSFVDSLNEIRLGHVSRMLLNTTQSIAEVAFQCGFNNMANFNRTFKSKKGLTPREFRESYAGKRIVI